MAYEKPSAKKKQIPGKRMPKADFITSIVLMTFSAFITVESLRMPRLEHRNINPYSIPGLVPAILGIIIGLLSITLFIRSMRHSGYVLRTREKADGSGQVKPGLFQKPETMRVLLTVGFCLLYAVILIGWVWYPVATFLFTFVFIVIFEYDRSISARQQVKTFVIAAVEALLTASVVSVVFRYLFLIRLP